jgi:riboflavin kinase/FMN adenylyltransferase
MGYPTINVSLPPARKLLPPQGVYAVRVQTRLGSFGGMMNLGPRPTFSQSQVVLEANLFDMSGDLYGSSVRFDFVARLRDTVRFENADALREQLQKDEKSARELVQLRHAGESRHPFSVDNGFRRSPE